MQWLYQAIADQWATPASIACDAGTEGQFTCTEARRTLLLGGYYATRIPDLGGGSGGGPLNLTVLGLNTNYWSLESNEALGESRRE